MSERETAGPRPMFTIGVPTYRRKEFLKQTLVSLVKQTYGDFEVLVGNDYLGEPLSGEALGVDDPRVRFLNYPRNVGELENMNALLGLAHGRYFTWQFDDDPCAPTLLDEVHSALVQFGFPACVFTSYVKIFGTSVYTYRKRRRGARQLLTGRDFLRRYLSGRLKVLGCCGFYGTDYLRTFGGAQRLSDGPMALHAEYLLAIRAGLLPAIAYVDAPLVSTRVHTDSWTFSNSDVGLFRQAGIGLIRESIGILSNEDLRIDFESNISSVLASVIGAVVVKSVMCTGRMDTSELRQYRARVEAEFHPLRGSPLYDWAVSGLNAALGRTALHVLKARLKMALPPELLSRANSALSLFSRLAGKPF